MTHILKLEISNRVEPPIEISRLIDYLPKSRNAKLARLMQLMGIYKEVGAGIDNIIKSIESTCLPMPKFITERDCFKAIIYTPMALVI